MSSPNLRILASVVPWRFLGERRAFERILTEFSSKNAYNFIDKPNMLWYNDGSKYTIVKMRLENKFLGR